MDKNTLKTLIPINSLTPENFRELAAEAVIENVTAGSQLFKQGDRDNQSIFLLSGEVALSTTDTTDSRNVVAGTDEARYALAQLKPRQYTGTAKTPVTVAWVDSATLDRLLTWDQTTGYEVTEFDGSQDPEWMIRMLRSETFQKLPPSNINALFARFEPVEVKANQVIIRQGDAGDFYYIIKTGKANVSRKAEKDGKVSVVGQLSEGDGFGEEALLSGAPRNATVVMAAEGILMRLARKDFDGLMREPLVKWVTLDQAKTLAQQGAGLLDVRTEDEFRNGTVKGSINLPLTMLRRKAAELDSRRHYVVLCQTGSRSCAAAFLLSQRGFEVSVLRGGLNGLTRNV
ncbi:MAG: cyclic nucleotide-binding domain-containing protein [Sulfuricaulis sp.]|uniref:cyclic nucleotide-binding domain-containing protein n=1 Tax=Sulfuricaulis sp. TaxID=2003553 RepID=UPI0025E602C0|nr:cyclic nucleotide-binding domain-containing protein [Sulfuricaulis sp.]MCR4346585.1 cyclic nucleotide-binding domain-containing protein [Sulfuricaulis sp.]